MCVLRAVPAGQSTLMEVTLGRPAGSLKCEKSSPASTLGPDLSGTVRYL